VIEESWRLAEASFFASATAKRALPLIQRRTISALRWRQGAHTGGMGAYSRARLYRMKSLAEDYLERIIAPTCLWHGQRRHPFTGVLLWALMITNEGPKLIEV